MGIEVVVVARCVRSNPLTLKNLIFVLCGPMAPAVGMFFVQLPAVSCACLSTNFALDSSSAGFSDDCSSPIERSVAVRGEAIGGFVYERSGKERLDMVGWNVASVDVRCCSVGEGYSKSSGRYWLERNSMVETTVALVDGMTVKASEKGEKDMLWTILGESIPRNTIS